MKDFDAAREERNDPAVDRTFRIGGELFEYRSSVRPEDLVAYDELTLSTPAGEVLRVADETIKVFLKDDDNRERWDALRARTEDPITGRDINDLTVWLIQMQTGRPTPAPSPSGDGRAPNGTPSTENSSPALAAVSKN